MLVGEMDDYEGVKTRLEEQLGEPIKGWAFQMAIDLGFVDNYLGEEIDYEYLETRYLGIIDQEDVRRRRAPKRGGVPTESGPDYRPVALAQVFAFEAADDPAVRLFREEILRGSLVEWENVEQWVDDQSSLDGPPTKWVTLPIDSEERVPVSRSGRPPQKGESVIEGNVTHYANRSRMQLAFPGRNNWVQYRPVHAGGVLDWLRIIAQKLSRRYGWKEADATGFVLSDAHPSLSRISTEIPSPWPWSKARRAVNLRIAFWATPEDVAGIYRELRNQILEDDPKPRALSKPRATLGVFAFQHRSGHTWDEAMTLWNERKLGPQYEDPRVFTRDARQAFKRITGEDLKWHGRATEPSA